LPFAGRGPSRSAGADQHDAPVALDRILDDLLDVPALVADRGLVALDHLDRGRSSPTTSCARSADGPPGSSIDARSQMFAATTGWPAWNA